MVRTEIEWELLTTKPIATSRDIESIVDIYETRWVIEEYFKALKTGCVIEKRELESSHSVFNLLAILIPIAWKLLRLRSPLAGLEIDLAGTTILSNLHKALMYRPRFLGQVDDHIHAAA